MRIESGLEELRILSTSKEDSAVDDITAKPLDGQSRQETSTSLDATQLEDQHLEHPNYHSSSSEARKSQQTPHLVVDGIYLKLHTPAEAFIKNLNALSQDEQEQVGIFIIDCCRMACYAFYEIQELWQFQSAFGSYSFGKLVGTEVRLPTNFTFFELREWLSRIQRALDPRGKNPRDSSGVDNYERARLTGFHDAERIPRLACALGGVDVLLCEESLVYAMNLCNHLKYWEGASWLKALHTKALEPDHGLCWATHFFPRWRTHRGLVLQRTPKCPESIPPLSSSTFAEEPRKPHFVARQNG